MTTAIETLMLTIETELKQSTASHRQLQGLLKQLRDEHKVKLECALNKSLIVLRQECERVVNCFCNGTLEEAAPAVKKQTKRAAATTHTVDKQEPVAAPSQPKQVALELQLTEAQAEIERLRRELADKTNEVAEYAEALVYANATIAELSFAAREREALDALERAEAMEAEVEPVVTEAVVEPVAVVEQLVVDTLLTLVNRKYGGRKGKALAAILVTIENLTDDKLCRILKEYGINSNLLEQAVDLVK